MRNLNAALPDNLYEALRTKAAQEERSIAFVVRRILMANLWGTSKGEQFEAECELVSQQIKEEGAL
jgi:plasmid stability protein